MTSFTICIDSPPESKNAHFNAIEFIRAAVANGHSIVCVFFAQEAVNTALITRDCPTDEWDPQHAWVALANELDISLWMCSAGAQRRGLVADKTLHAPFAIGGLGELVMSTYQCQHLVQF